MKEKKNILLSNISTLNSQKEFYANVIENHEGRPSGIKHILNDREKYPFVLGVLSDIIEVDDPYQLAVETALGEYGNFLVVDSLIFLLFHPFKQTSFMKERRSDK